MRKYRLIAKKGEGTFSEVLKAQSVKNGKCYAIKCMKTHFNSIEQVNNLREIQALRRLSPHPNIVQMEEVLYDKPTGRLALVFELMDMNLYELIRGRRHHLDPQLVKIYMFQLMRALAHMHQKNVFHRDLKPENILIENNYDVHTGLKLADFGSCRGTYSKQPYTEYISTRWYRAPECLLTDGWYGAEMDIWGAGCVMFEISCLYPLVPGENELDQIKRIHDVFGTPTSDVMAFFKQRKSAHVDFSTFGHRKGKGLRKMAPNMAPVALDLLTGLLQYDPRKRLTADQALQHDYFAELRRVPEPDFNLTAPSRKASTGSAPQPTKPAGTSTTKSPRAAAAAAAVATAAPVPDEAKAKDATDVVAAVASPGATGETATVDSVHAATGSSGAAAAAAAASNSKEDDAGGGGQSHRTGGAKSKTSKHGGGKSKHHHHHRDEDGSGESRAGSADGDTGGGGGTEEDSPAALRRARRQRRQQERTARRAAAAAAQKVASDDPPLDLSGSFPNVNVSGDYTNVQTGARRKPRKHPNRHAAEVDGSTSGATGVSPRGGGGHRHGHSTERSTHKHTNRRHRRRSYDYTSDEDDDLEAGTRSSLPAIGGSTHRSQGVAADATASLPPIHGQSTGMYSRRTHQSTHSSVNHAPSSTVPPRHAHHQAHHSRRNEAKSPTAGEHRRDHRRDRHRRDHRNSSKRDDSTGHSTTGPSTYSQYSQYNSARRHHGGGGGGGGGGAAPAASSKFGAAAYGGRQAAVASNAALHQHSLVALSSRSHAASIASAANMSAYNVGAGGAARRRRNKNVRSRYATYFSDKRTGGNPIVKKKPAPTLVALRGANHHYHLPAASPRNDLFRR